VKCPAILENGKGELTMRSWKMNKAQSFTKRWLKNIALGLAAAFFLAVSLEGVRGQQAKTADSIGRTQRALTVVNEKGKAVSFSADQIAKLPRLTVKAKDHSGVDAAYDGVPLAELLKAADVTMGKQFKGALVANYLLVDAADGFRAVYSLPEVDPALTDNVVVLADHKDGKLLDANEGPLRLIVPRDKLFMRWVRQVTAISVQAAPKRSK
jgi:DMSO/TMAO reductase YedYZ molybdopterin-dependent catalytic subunit